MYICMHMYLILSLITIINFDNQPYVTICTHLSSDSEGCSMCLYTHAEPKE